MTETRTAQELYRALCARLNDGLPWNEIAVEFGCPVKELCDFVLGYREPRQEAKRVRDAVMVGGCRTATSEAMARKLATWRKSREAIAS